MTDVRRRLPAVHTLLDDPALADAITRHGRGTVTDWIRTEIAAFRDRIENVDSANDPSDPAALIRAAVLHAADDARARAFGKVVNATGVVLHTGLGRAPFSDRAIAAIRDVAGTGNVELDLLTGERRDRGHQLRPAIRRLTGCEDAVVVNNNAAATLLVLTALCGGREVVISRGQLVEIGGSFRLPEIFALGGVTLREVGTTNRTTLADYERAIGPETAAILRVHPSNYRIEGFAAMPEIESLVPLAREHDVLCIDDIGSGCLVDTTRLGLPEEPTFQRSIAAGADVVLGSGDKLLGGPQAGLVVGTNAAIDRIRTHPFARTVRVDKLTLAALDATLAAYVHGTEFEEVPVLRMLVVPLDELRGRANRIVDSARPTTLRMERRDDVATIGGGSIPGAELPTAVIAITHADRSAEELAAALRTGSPRVLPRVRDDAVLLDLRSVLPADDTGLVAALRHLEFERR